MLRSYLIRVAENGDGFRKTMSSWRIFNDQLFCFSVTHWHTHTNTHLNYTVCNPPTSISLYSPCLAAHQGHDLGSCWILQHFVMTVTCNTPTPQRQRLMMRSGDKHQSKFIRANQTRSWDVWRGRRLATPTSSPLLWLFRPQSPGAVAKQKQKHCSLLFLVSLPTTCHFYSSAPLRFPHPSLSLCVPFSSWQEIGCNTKAWASLFTTDSTNLKLS